MAEVHKDSEEFEKSLSLAFKALEIVQSYQSTFDEDWANIYSNIGSLYC